MFHLKVSFKLDNYLKSYARKQSGCFFILNTVYSTDSVVCFDLPRQQWSLVNRLRTKQGMDTAVPVEENGDLQTLICVLAARSRRCHSLSNPVLWQSWMAAYPGSTLCRWRRCFLAYQYYRSWHAYEKKKFCEIGFYCLNNVRNTVMISDTSGQRYEKLAAIIAV